MKIFSTLTIVLFFLSALNGQDIQGLEISILNANVSDGKSFITLDLEYRNTSTDTITILNPESHFFENNYNISPFRLYEQQNYPYKIHISQDTSILKATNENKLSLRKHLPHKLIHLKEGNLLRILPNSLRKITTYIDLNGFAFHASDDYIIEIEYRHSFNKITKEQYRYIKEYEIQIDKLVEEFNVYIEKENISEKKLIIKDLKPNDISTPKYFINGTDLLDKLYPVNKRSNQYKIKGEKLFYDIPPGKNKNPFEITSSGKYYIYSDGYTNLYDSIEEIDIKEVQTHFPKKDRFLITSCRQAIIENGIIIKEWGGFDIGKMKTKPKSRDSKYYGKYYLTSTVPHESYIRAFGKKVSSLTLYKPETRIGNLNNLKTMCWDDYSACLEYAKKKSLEKKGKIILSIVLEKTNLEY